MYILYILKSEAKERHYTGITKDIKERLQRHNQGRNKSTRAHKPWKIIYTEQYKTKLEALKREKQIKSWKKGEAFKKLLKHAGVV